MSNLTLGSLFDGSGGFTLGATLTGITPLWASEIEPFPIRVTTKRMPFVKHYGDIRKINGGEIEPVDIITFGSPCQDISIAGKREGIDGSRSSLFYEAIRVIKEMRCKTNGKYPRFIIWENVCGAFTSNRGEDFKKIINEIVQIKTNIFNIPKPKKWRNSGLILGDDFSIGWRVFNARYWGVPQRRCRIYLVADFAGERAKEILFNCKNGVWDFTKSLSKEQKATSNIRECIKKSDRNWCLSDQGGERMDIAYGESATLRAKGGHPPYVFDNHSSTLRFNGPNDVSQTVLSTYGTGGNNQPFVVESYDVRITSEKTKNSRANIYETKTSRALDTQGNNPNSNQGGIVVCSTSKASFHTKTIFNETSALVASDYKDPPVINIDYIVRRLTPTECARLQGFPDCWCKDLETNNPSKEDLIFWRAIFDEYCKINNKKLKTDNQIIKWLQNPHSDSAEYKMWGNGVALPNVLFILNNVKK